MLVRQLCSDICAVSVVEHRNVSTEFLATTYAHPHSCHSTATADATVSPASSTCSRYRDCSCLQGFSGLKGREWYGWRTVGEQDCDQPAHAQGSLSFENCRAAFFAQGRSTSERWCALGGAHRLPHCGANLCLASSTRDASRSIAFAESSPSAQVELLSTLSITSFSCSRLAGFGKNLSKPAAIAASSASGIIVNATSAGGLSSARRA